MGLFKRASTDPQPLPSPTPSNTSSSSSDSSNNESSWFANFRANKANTFLLHSPHGDVTPIYSPTPERPVSWFARSKTMSPSPSPEKFREQVEEDVERSLSPEKEYELLPKWRRDASKKRVREMRMFLGIPLREEPPEVVRELGEEEAQITKS